MTVYATIGWYIVIGVIGYGIWSKYPIRLENTRRIVILSLLIALNILASKFLSFSIYIGGFVGLKISLVQVLYVLSAMLLLSPSEAFLVGILIDIFSFFLFGQGIFYPGFIFNSIMVFLIGYIGLSAPIKYIKILNVIGLSVCGILGILCVYVQPAILWNVFGVFLELLILVSISLILKQRGILSIYRLVFIFLAIEIGINIVSTSSHLTILYNIPFLTSVYLRLVKMLFMLPISIGLCALVYTKLQRVKTYLYQNY